MTETEAISRENNGLDDLVRYANVVGVVGLIAGGVASP